MKLKQLAPLLLLLPIAFACAGENALARVEQSCLKFPTPEARADCEKSKKASMTAFDNAKKAQEKDAAADADPKPKKNELCFKRQSTGEMVCPN